MLPMVGPVGKACPVSPNFLVPRGMCKISPLYMAGTSSNGSPRAVLVSEVTDTRGCRGWLDHDSQTLRHWAGWDLPSILRQRARTWRGSKMQDSEG